MTKMAREEILKKLTQSIIEAYDVEESIRLAKEALKEGIDPIEIIEKGISSALRIVGERFERQEYFLPDLIASGTAAKECSDLVKDELMKAGRTHKALGKVVIGTVAGDIHDLGKSIVISILEANGFEVYDLGVDVPAEKFIESVRELKPDILGMSALLTVTREEQRRVVEDLNKKGLRDRVKVMVGGAVVKEEWAKEIGADAYGADAIDALRKAKMLIKTKRTNADHNI